MIWKNIIPYILPVWFSMLTGKAIVQGDTEGIVCGITLTAAVVAFQIVCSYYD